jgi:hypothetical protein
MNQLLFQRKVLSDEINENETDKNKNLGKTRN